MGHGHGHHHDHEAATALPAAFDASVPDETLSPERRSRRSLLRRAGPLAAVPAAGGTPVPFEVPEPTPCRADH
ncbi:hypothetical protein [Streptomyces sp. NPDC088766]|uniref:hypothetical protein n=1 Tax=Streptomyces sp. NPDC088766 TaxID=3365893 RepID=UPI0038160F70